MREKLEKWCKKHSHLLVFIGAIIVFLTFVIKEGLGERWKETADAINLAKYFYAVTDDATVLERSVGHVQELMNKGFQVDHPTPTAIALLQAQVRVTARREMRDRIERNVHQINILADKLPKDDAVHNAITTLTTELESVSSKIKTLEDATLNGTYKGSPIIVVSNGDAELIPELEELHKDTFLWLVGANGTANRLVADVLRDAEETQRRNERHSVEAWWISAFLFALGWGLGLVGKLYGVPEAAGGD
jgi:hypothetical protein